MLFHHPDLLRHIAAPDHIETPRRIEAILRKLEAHGLEGDLEPASPAARDEVLAVHDRSYVERLEAFGEGFLDTDTPIHAGTMAFAHLAAGGAVMAARRCVAAQAPTMALVRPPGHHAGADYGGGFCYLNNVAIAAGALRQALPKVAILDVDAHHGNGTADIFARDASVLYVSTHQSNLYPGTGAARDMGKGAGLGFTVNLPLPASSGDSTYALAFGEVVEPIVRAFRPDAILVSLGVDAHVRDPLANLSLSSVGYLALVRGMIDLSGELSKGRIAFVLEGGYHLPALSEVVVGIAAAFRGESTHLQFKETDDATERGRAAVMDAKARLATHWDL